MTEQFYLYLVGMIFAFVVSVLSIYWVGLVKAADKLRKESQKLQLIINNARSDYVDIRRHPQDLIGAIAQNVGIDGLLESFGIDAGILSNPMVKGLISKFAPKVMEAVQKKQEASDENPKYL